MKFEERLKRKQKAEIKLKELRVTMKEEREKYDRKS